MNIKLDRPVLIGLTISGFVSHMFPAIIRAQNWQIGCLPGSPLCEQSIQSGLNSTFQISGLISRIVGLLTIIAGLYFFFQLIIVGFNWITAGGDKTQIQTAQKKLQTAIIGLIISVMAYGITYIIGTFLGLPIFGFDTLIWQYIRPQ